MTEQRKGQWEKCTFKEYVQALGESAAYEIEDGTFKRWVPAPDERDAEIARLKSELAEAKKPYPASRCRAIYYDGTTCDEHTREFDEQQAEILKCNRCATTRFADVASAIARVTERATRIYCALLDENTWEYCYEQAEQGEPAHAEMVKRVKAGGA